MGHIKERKGDRQPDPILKLRQSHLKAIKVIERDAHETDAGQIYAPNVSIWWEILNDGKNSEHNGVRFWDKFSFVKSFEDPSKYVIREDTRIGDLAAFVAYEFEDGADYFEDDVDVDFEVLEDAEIVAQLEPRQFMDQAPTGTRTVSKTLMLAEKAQRVAAGLKGSQQAATAAKTAPEVDEVDDPDWDDLPI